MAKHPTRLQGRQKSIDPGPPHVAGKEGRIQTEAKRQRANYLLVDVDMAGPSRAESIGSTRVRAAQPAEESNRGSTYVSAAGRILYRRVAKG